MAFHQGNIEAVEQPSPLLLSERDGATWHLAWPLELRLLKALVPKAKACSVPVQHFELIALAIAKDKQRTTERRERHFALNNGT